MKIAQPTASGEHTCVPFLSFAVLERREPCNRIVSHAINACARTLTTPISMSKLYLYCLTLRYISLQSTKKLCDQRWKWSSASDGSAGHVGSTSAVAHRPQAARVRECPAHSGLRLPKSERVGTGFRSELPLFPDYN